MDFESRIVAPEYSAVDELENSLRPKSLKEYIGRISKIRIYQEPIVENNTVYFKSNIYFIIDTDFNQKISIIFDNPEIPTSVKKEAKTIASNKNIDLSFVIKYLELHL